MLGILVLIIIATNGLHDVAQTALNGLALGSVYALGAVGLTLVYGILKLINFAHGDFLTFGAYMAFLVNVTWGGPLVLGIAFARCSPPPCWRSSSKAHVGSDARAQRRVAAAPADVDRARVPAPLQIQFIWGTEIRVLDVTRDRPSSSSACASGAPN